MITRWLFWTVPEQYIMRYLVTLLLIMFVIPYYIFGLYYTKLGIIINLLWYDLIFYGWFRAKQMIGDDE